MLLLGVVIAFALTIHAWWLPRNEINGWIGEPKARYYIRKGGG